ncbi:MAG: hypothetical protein AUJ01_11795 [Acidobacteria bacterium 13_1_40CM_3_65_5]|nr:MAG: hypothetical protein AUJ01_11795 [Acidobacteria bacterium 13_1_40CM_3_65_5]
MNRTILAVGVGLATALWMVVQPSAQSPAKHGPRLSSFFDFEKADSFEVGLGNIDRFSCFVGALTQPKIYGGNMLVDCDAEVPHNETTIAVNPNDPLHAAGGYHSYQLVQVGSSVHLHVVGTASVTIDGGRTWREVVPPINPYQFTGDPALAFAANGRLYFGNIADHEGQGGGNFTGPSVVVASSDDGGVTWSKPVTVASGQGGIDAVGVGPQIFQDKDFIAVDTSAGSPHENRVYASWTSFQSKFAGTTLFRSPIMTAFSDDGVNWSAGREVSGFSPSCSSAFIGAPNECDLNQFSYPTVAPTGKVYLSFENFNTPAENQMMVVSSDDGGAAWSAPSRVDTLFDINFPENVDGRATLTGCQLRVSAAANAAADPSDPTGRTAYVTWADNRNGTAKRTNTDVFLARSTDGGATWNRLVVDSTTNDQFFPWVAVAPNGRVDVGYMDRSYSAGQNVCQYGFTLARVMFDSTGRARITRQRVDTGLSDPGHSRWFSGTTNGNARFIGDYNGVASGPDGATWSLWTDQRNLVLNPPSSTQTHGQHAVGALTAAR